MKRPTRIPAGPAILLVDDNPTLAELAAGYLRGAGYRVTVTTGLAEAEALLAHGRFALVLADPFRLATSLLGTDRWTNLRRLCALAGGTPVVICSPYGADDFADYRQRGFAALLQKPYRPADLLAAVHRVLAGTAP
jgi:CheY-like chemotaxis protein